MYFAEFYHLSTGYPDGNKKLIPACGDRSVIILDGREKRESQKAVCMTWADKHGYKGFRIYKGDSFTRGLQPLTDLIAPKVYLPY